MPVVDAEPVWWPPPRPVWRPSMGALVWFAVLPAVGLLAELALGMLSEMLSLFPSGWHVVAVVFAVLLNAALHRGAWRRSEALPWRAFAIGYVGGMAALYAVAEAPATPFMVMFALFVIGVLAMAPFFVLLGWFWLYGDLVKCWRADRQPLGRCRVLVALGALLPLPLMVLPWDGDTTQTVRDMRAIDDLLRSGADEVRIDAIAARLRAGDLDLQRQVCERGVTPSGRLRHELVFGRGAGRISGEPFWFIEALQVSMRAGVFLTASAASSVFERVHGQRWATHEAWQQPADWYSSRYTIHTEPAAALARVDHELELRSDAGWGVEVRLHVELPPGAVASSLSAWIDGVERPAAFASAGTAQAAYEQVVNKQLDPVLLQQETPQRLLLRMGPLGKRFAPMRARIGYTVPLLVHDDGLHLQLPFVVEHECTSGPAHHAVQRDGIDSQRTDAELREPWVSPVPTFRAVHCTDADGTLVQTLRPRTTRPANELRIVLLEASASVGACGVPPIDLLRALGDGTPCLLCVVHGRTAQHCEAAIGSAQLTAFVNAQSFTGGVDPQAALLETLAIAEPRGVREVLWLHGRAGDSFTTTMPAAASALPNGANVRALALHPGPHRVRERRELQNVILPLPSEGLAPDALRRAVHDWSRFADVPQAPLGDRQRHFERAATPPPDASPVSDQLARLWAAGEATLAARTEQPEPARSLARRYRLVTADTSAVVLEKQEQYDAFGLDPGAAIGREPERPIGSGPVPEPATWTLLLGGLFAACWLQRRRAR